MSYPVPFAWRAVGVDGVFYMEHRHQQAKYSLQCRGKHVEDMNKTELLDLLYDDIILEKKVPLLRCIATVVGMPKQLANIRVVF